MSVIPISQQEPRPVIPIHVAPSNVFSDEPTCRRQGISLPLL